ncbi:MAG: hypothetical protein EOO80_14900 [Oxalobacteraceae bacterium]|nr:MAG: hypothetical protein EOO80_14900 [Oxalobacteraceae bacterium]
MRIVGRNYGERISAARASRDLDRMVEEIARHVPRMRRAYATDAEFWHWLTGELDSVRRNAATVEDRTRYTGKLRDALRRAGVAVDLIAGAD